MGGCSGGGEKKNKRKKEERKRTSFGAGEVVLDWDGSWLKQISSDLAQARYTPGTETNEQHSDHNSGVKGGAVRGTAAPVKQRFVKQAQLQRKECAAELKSLRCRGR